MERKYKNLSCRKIGFEIDRNISFVPKFGLCTMCSTCESVCPEDAVVIRVNRKKGTYEPHVLEEKCVQCGICVDTCPGFELDLKGLADNSQNSCRNKFIGSYNEILRMYSTDSVISKSGTSGGMVTGMLDFLLSGGMIDGAIVTRMNEDSPLETVSYVASTREELLLSQKSKYLPTRLNGILKPIIRGHIPQKKMAFVGLPCHIEGLRLAQQLFPVLKERIVFVFSLFCSRTPTFHASEFLLDCNGINRRDLKRIDYRGHGHPGKLTFHLKNGSSLSVDHLHWTYWGHAFLNFFWPSRCFVCPDKTGELADISIGDNWQGLWTSVDASSSVIVRNPKMKELAHQMVSSDKAVVLNTIDAKELIRDQDLKKKRSIGPRLLLMRLIGRKTPLYYEKFDLPFKEIPGAFRLMIHMLVTEHNIPFHFLRTYIYLSYRKKFFLNSLKRRLSGNCSIKSVCMAPISILRFFYSLLPGISRKG